MGEVSVLLKMMSGEDEGFDQGQSTFGGVKQEPRRRINRIPHTGDRIKIG